MGVWTQSLKFSVGTGDIHQFPQTTGDGLHSLLQQVVWDVRANVPNPVPPNFSILPGFARCTSSFAQPHRKKSQDVRSGLPPLRN